MKHTKYQKKYLLFFLIAVILIFSYLFLKKENSIKPPIEEKKSDKTTSIDIEKEENTKIYTLKINLKKKNVCFQ
jgi:hypothetical protein